jgi:2-polyprenyl-6-methoxyphenol hydroxylase-like FAD-dependent oxidoreductase
MSGTPGEWDVIIAGAGVGGAACALALARDSDLRILLIERHPGPGNLNRGENLLPPVTGLLKRWGALDRCRAAGAREVEQMRFFHHRAGLLLDVPLKLAGVEDPYLTLPHPEIERVLVETAQASGRVEVRYRSRLVDLVKRRGRVTGVILRGELGAEEEAACRLVVGADGAASRVRAALGIGLPRRRYGHSLFGIDIDRPPGLPDVLRTELHGDGGVLVVPGVDRLGLAAVVRREQEHLFQSGSIEQRYSHIERRSPLFEGRRPSPRGMYLYKLWRGHASLYWAPGAALIGDAIHVINPVMAQGMTMAIEDAAALARLVGAALRGGANGTGLDAALAAYEKRRRPFNASVIRNSHWLSLLFSLGGPIGDAFHRRAFQFANSSIGRIVQRSVWSSFATSPEGLCA